MKRFLQVLLLCVTSLWAFGASAQFLVEPTEIRFGPSPGEVIFDASGTKKAFPVPNEIRSFGGWPDFYQFLESELNAQILRDPATGAVSSVLIHAVSIDRPRYLDREMQTFLPVPHEIMWLIGGPSGYIEVKGELICFNRSRCGDPQLPPPPVMFNVTPDFWAYVRAIYAEPYYLWWDHDDDESTDKILGFFEDFGAVVGIANEDWSSILDAHSRRCGACDKVYVKACVDVDCDSSQETITRFYVQAQAISADPVWETSLVAPTDTNIAEWRATDFKITNVLDGVVMEYDRAATIMSEARVWYDGAEYIGVDPADPYCEGPACPRP